MSGILGTTDDRVMSGRVPLWFNLFLVPADKADYVLGKFTHIATKYTLTTSCIALYFGAKYIRY